MKWKSHIAIANAIADEMVLDKDLKIALANGSIEPDKRPDLAFWTSRNGHHFIGRAPHHTPPTGTIMAYVWRARKAYLDNNDWWAIKSAGRALHYIQDKSTSPGWRGISHDRREADIARLDVPIEAVHKGVEMAICSPKFIRECIIEIRPQKDPERALYEATMYSSMVFASIFGPPDASERFQAKAIKIKREHMYRYPLAGSAVGISAFLAYMTADPLLLGVGAVAAFALVRMDLKYYRITSEAEWFGLEQ